MSTKKGKKKATPISLQEFHAQVSGGAGPSPGQNVVYAPKKLPVTSSWADEVEEDDMSYVGGSEAIILPSAPRSSRGPAYDDASIPRAPPYTAHLGNISYDISEDDVIDFFRGLSVSDLRLPRDLNTNRLRGFGYVEFATREQLIEALVMNESVMRGRPVRISLGQPGQGARDGGGRDGGRDRMGQGGGFEESAPDDDWRGAHSRNPPQGPESRDGDFRRNEGGGPRRNNRDFDSGGGASFDNIRSEMRSEGGGGGGGPPHQDDEWRRGGGGPPDRGGGGYGGDRDRFGGDRDRYGGDRGGDRGFGGDRDRGYGGDRDRGFGGDRDRGYGGDRDRGYGGDRDRGYGGDRDRRGYDRPASPDFVRQPVRERDPSPKGPPQGSTGSAGSTADPPRERRKLVLAPRTVDPTDKEAEPAGEGGASIFGGARPVDTAAREREIEKKLEKLYNAPGGERGGGPEKVTRILQRPSRAESETSDDLPPMSSSSTEKSGSDTRGGSGGSTTARPAPTTAAPPPPPPATNPWNARQRAAANTQPETTEIIMKEKINTNQQHQDKDTNSEPEDERDLRSSAYVRETDILESSNTKRSDQSADPEKPGQLPPSNENEDDDDDFQRVERRSTKQRLTNSVNAPRGGGGGVWTRGGGGARAVPGSNPGVVRGSGTRR